MNYAEHIARLEATRKEKSERMKAIQQKAPSDEILKLAVQEGMTTLEQDALEKTMQGHLDLKQVLASCR